MEKHRAVKPRHAVLPLALTLIGGIDCGANIPPPNNEWAAAQADVGRAQAAGAPNNPDARLHLQLALEDLAASKKLFDEDNKRATSIAALARAEAQLAFSLSKVASAEAQARSAETAPDRTTGR
jgi:hypothetical protein